MFTQPVFDIDGYKLTKPNNNCLEGSWQRMRAFPNSAELDIASGLEIDIYI